jgi:hypothetical protein
MTVSSAIRAGVSGAVDRVLSKNLEHVLAIPGRRLYRQFVAAAEDVAKTQSDVLDEILHYARETEYGRQHCFAEARGYSGYAQRVRSTSTRICAQP